MVSVRIMHPAHGDMVHPELTTARAAEIIMEEKNEGRGSFAQAGPGVTHQIETIATLMEWLESDPVKDAVVSVIPNIAGG